MFTFFDTKQNGSSMKEIMHSFLGDQGCYQQLCMYGTYVDHIYIVFFHHI
jgi:hypothetical protein